MGIGGGREEIARRTRIKSPPFPDGEPVPASGLKDLATGNYFSGTKKDDHPVQEGG